MCLHFGCFALIYIQSQGSLRAFEGGYADDKDRCVLAICARLLMLENVVNLHSLSFNAQR